MSKKELKKVLEKLERLSKRITELNPRNPVHRRLASTLVSFYLSFVETAIGHKRRTKKLIEWTQQQKLKQNKSKASNYLSWYRAYWQFLLPKADKDPKSNTRDWQTNHLYEKETVKEFLLELFRLSNENQLLIEKNEFHLIKVQDFKEYLERYIVLENDYLVSAKNFGRTKK